MTRPLERVEMTVTGWGPGIDVTFGPSSIYKFGYCWFRYQRLFAPGPVFNGPLMFVNFIDSVWFPEAKKAVGFQWQLFKTVTATAVSYEIPLVQNITVAGQTIDPMSQTLVNLNIL